MSGSVNKVILIGNLGRDPEVKFWQDGKKHATFSIATSDSWKDKNTGEKKEQTEWHRISILNEKLAEVAERYLRKGSKVYIEGQLQTKKWTDKQTNLEKQMVEIVLSNFKGTLVLLDAKNQESMYQVDSVHSGFSTAPQREESFYPDPDLNDEIPF